MAEMLKRLTEVGEEYRESLTPEKRYIHDFLSWGYRLWMVYGIVPTQEMIEEYIDEWNEKHPEEFKKLFIIDGEQRY